MHTIQFSDAGLGGWSAALEPPTVLVADDDESVREMVAFKLQAAGYRTLVAEDGRTAMALAVGERPELVLLDVSMPGMDGLAFCYELHSSAQTAHTPVIFMSGRGAPADVDLGRVAGAEDYMVKPIDLADLVRRVQLLLGH
ncbi:response regulator [Actinoplanes sp. NPDC051851]|uniref:response regulator transcription factor n=1 Tax=Actinoplanes sp. NPDC051851 TaxID=3154753 RepID=UPI00342B467B